MEPEVLLSPSLCHKCSQDFRKKEDQMDAFFFSAGVCQREVLRMALQRARHILSHFPSRSNCSQYKSEEGCFSCLSSASHPQLSLLVLPARLSSKGAPWVPLNIARELLEAKIPRVAPEAEEMPRFSLCFWASGFIPFSCSFSRAEVEPELLLCTGQLSACSDPADSTNIPVTAASCPVNSLYGHLPAFSLLSF